VDPVDPDPDVEPPVLPPVPDPEPDPDPPDVDVGLGDGLAWAEKVTLPEYPEDVTRTGTTRIWYPPAALPSDTDSLAVPVRAEDAT
jgi:hypothetical protein